MKKTCSKRAFDFYEEQGACYAFSLSSIDTDFQTIGLEIEILEEADTSAGFFKTITGLGRVMESDAQDTTQVATNACDTVFNLLDKYDRGMVYRFNDDLSGEVIHEVKHSHLETSYIGMRFPSSDIPLPARQLYIKNGLRYIHDVDTAAVPLLSFAGTETDLSQCRMRAVGKPHILYLKNMGVKCSMSLAIVVDGALWGLLAFHGYTEPYKPSLHKRIACETITSMMSVRIEALVKKAQSFRVFQLSGIMMNLRQDQSVIHNLCEWGDRILEILDVDVLVGHVEDARGLERDEIILGDQSLTPSEDFWHTMATQPRRELCVLSTRQEVDNKGLTVEECPACGIVYFREGRTHILVGRRARAQDVAWAGNPDEPKLRIGGILSPRNSFNTFMEKARMESRGWSVQDINVMTYLRDRICEHSHNYTMKLLQTDIEDTNSKYLNAIDRADENYEFFAHMSHELRTPFHGVMGCLSILQESVFQIKESEVMDLLNTALSSGDHMYVPS